MSFPVFFQCKRYPRGQSLLVTTGSFTTDAKKEAARDGTPPIDLIDGDRLCKLLKQCPLSVRAVTRTVEAVSIDQRSSAGSDDNQPGRRHSRVSLCLPERADWRITDPELGKRSQNIRRSPGISGRG